MTVNQSAHSNNVESCTDDIIKKKTVFGIPCWVVITIITILVLGGAAAGIGYPLLKAITLSESASTEDDTSTPPITTIIEPIEPEDPLTLIQRQWVDPDTPEALRVKKMEDGTVYQLVFSDEFNKDGREFARGKDKKWEGVDLHYWQTGDYEHYVPEQATTKDGKLRITLEEKPTKGQRFASAMLQTWNNFCFRGGYLEARVSLPGNPRVSALWPAIWTLGNLGRAGYGATTDGLWPYSYNECDQGVLPKQNRPDLSDLPGQRLNKCLCKDQDTPSPGIGRGAPEIDLLEGAGGDSGNDGGGTVSQSHQFAPFDLAYNINEQHVKIHNTETTYWNSYKGGKLQQAASIKTKIPDNYYEGRDYLTFAFAYEPGPKGWVAWWVGDDKKWSMDAQAVGPNPHSGIGQRVISEEPMYIIMNLAMSEGFGGVDFANLKLPATMYVDYIRIYQHPDKIDVGCDPADRPTKKYIDEHPLIYQNASMKSFAESGYPLPTFTIGQPCPPDDI